MAKRLPEWFDKEFPDWKKNLIGAFRAFFTGFIGALATALTFATPDNIQDKDYWLFALLIGSFSGALIYLGKWLRDKFFESSIVQKIPI